MQQIPAVTVISSPSASLRPLPLVLAELCCQSPELSAAKSGVAWAPASWRVGLSCHPVADERRDSALPAPQRWVFFPHSPLILYFANLILLYSKKGLKIKRNMGIKIKGTYR